jgi:uncharacterized protein (TIGR02996 family)
MSVEQKTGIDRLDRALLLEREGRVTEARAEVEAMALEWRDAPDVPPGLLVRVGRSLQAMDLSSSAESLAESALARWPADAALHGLLVELRWQRGAGPDAAAPLERAILAHPRELQLRLVAADLLRHMGFPARALEWLEGGLAAAPESAAFLTSIGVVLGDLDRPRDALPYLRAAIPASRQPANARRNLVPALLRTGEVTEALETCDVVLATAPDDQMTLAYRSTALRMLGDGRYAALCDYARLVRVHDLEPAAGHGDIATFNATFARALRALHTQSRRPIAQSLRGGTQTARHLPARLPVIADFFAMIDAPIRDYVSRLDARSSHPVDRRRSPSYSIRGSWSVLLSPGGFHIDHVHPEGWLSSAYYVELPPGEPDEARAGWIKFGEPGVKLGLAAEHFVEPRAGRLVLFPSYFWHGTVPFRRGGGRLTAAFDVAPA